MQDMQSEKQDTILVEEKTVFLLLHREITQSMKFRENSFLNISFMPKTITKTLVLVLV